MEMERDSLKGLAKLTKKGELQSRIDRKKLGRKTEGQMIASLLFLLKFPDLLTIVRWRTIILKVR